MKRKNLFWREVQIWEVEHNQNKNRVEKKEEKKVTLGGEVLSLWSEKMAEKDGEEERRVEMQ